MNIFREEVVARQRHRLEGDISMALPPAWKWCAILLFAGVIAAALFLSVASYARVTVVSGTLEPAAGVARIVASAPGTLERLFVEPGQRIRAGAALATIRTGLTLSAGERAYQAQLDTFRSHGRTLDLQAEEVSAAALSRADGIDRQIADHRAAVEALSGQIEIQNTLVRSALDEVETARAATARGFVSKRDMHVREENYATRRQELLRLQRERDQNQRAISEAYAQKRTMQAEARAQAAALAAQRLDIAQRSTEADSQDAYQLTAPTTGRIALVTARRGDNVAAAAPLMAIVPDGSPLRAELSVPNSALGFIAVGQEVRLAVDAFPYQRFGTIPARIEAIAAAPVARSAENGDEKSYYPVTARLGRDWIAAYGERRALVTGMSFSARIVTERRTLLGWLLGPLTAAGER